VRTLSSIVAGGYLLIIGLDIGDSSSGTGFGLYSYIPGKIGPGKADEFMLGELSAYDVLAPFCGLPFDEEKESFLKNPPAGALNRC